MTNQLPEYYPEPIDLQTDNEGYGVFYDPDIYDLIRSNDPEDDEDFAFYAPGEAFYAEEIDDFERNTAQRLSRAYNFVEGIPTDSLIHELRTVQVKEVLAECREAALTLVHEYANVEDKFIPEKYREGGLGLLIAKLNHLLGDISG